MNLLFKYTTRERPEWFLRGLKNIVNTLSDLADYEVLVSIDEDDTTMDKQVIAAASFICDKITWDIGQSRTKIEAINRGVHKAKTNWQVLLNMSDDMLFQYPSWDKTMLKRINDEWQGSTDFFAHFDDGDTGQKIASMSIIGKKYYERTWRIYPREYHSLYADNHVKEEAILLGRYKYFEDVIFKHLHPANAPVEQDLLYIRNELYSSIDKEIFNKNKLINFSIDKNSLN